MKCFAKKHSADKVGQGARLNWGDVANGVDEGDWVNAQFTVELKSPVDGDIRNVFYEFYHIIDGKVVSWDQFKRGEKE